LFASEFRIRTSFRGGKAPLPPLYETLLLSAVYHMLNPGRFSCVYFHLPMHQLPCCSVLGSASIILSVLLTGKLNTAEVRVPTLIHGVHPSYGCNLLISPLAFQYIGYDLSNFAY